MAKWMKKATKSKIKEQSFLRGKQVYLRALGPEDISNDYLAWLNDPEVLRYRTTRLPTTLRQLAAWIKNPSPPDRLVLAVRLNEDDRHVGNISLAKFEWTHGTAELAIMIGAKDTWGRGVGTESIELLSGHAFNALGLHRLSAESANPSYNRCMERLGWIHEGTRREALFVDGKHIAIECWGLLASEWFRSKE
jgi:RimJ/RimL family protein N-acetyltransferase